MQPLRDWHVPVPEALWRRLQFVRQLDGRALTEWARAVLSREADRVLTERPGWLWTRPDAPYWRDPGPAVTVASAPIGALAGCDRVLVLARLADAIPPDLDPDGDGSGLLADVVPDQLYGGRVLRRVLLRSSDVLPCRSEPQVSPRA